MSDIHAGLDIFYWYIFSWCLDESPFLETLIDNDQIESIELTGTLIDRLDAGDDDGIVGIATFQTCRVDTEVHLGADCGSLVGRLLQKLFDMGQNEDSTLPERDRILADRGHTGGLAPRCRNDHARIVIAIAQMVVDRVDRSLLVGT